MRKDIDRRKTISVYSIGVSAFFLPFFAFGLAWLNPVPETFLQRASVYLTVGSPVLLVISAVVILRQVHEVYESRLQSGFEEISSAIHNMGVISLQHSDLYPFFYEGKSVESLPPDDRNRAKCLAEVYVDILDGIMLRCDTFYQAASNEDIEYLRTWTLDCFKRSPVMCNFVLDNERWYRKPLVDIARASRTYAEELTFSKVESFDESEECQS